MSKMKLLVLAIFLNCIFADPCRSEGPDPEETCEIDGIVEIQRGLIFGINIDFNGEVLDIFTKNYDQLEFTYLAYRDNFRQLYQYSNGTMRDNWRSRVDYYFQRLRLTTQEMINEARIGNHRCIQYIVDVATRTIICSFTCQSSPECSCNGPIRYDCSGQGEFNNKTKCVTYTMKVSERPEELGSERGSRSLSPQNLIVLHDVVSRLYDARNSHTLNRSFETLRLQLERFFRLMHIVRIRRRVILQAHYPLYRNILGRLNVDVIRLMTNDEYFIDTMRRPEMWFNDNADELENVLKDRDPVGNAETGPSYTSDPSVSHVTLGNSESINDVIFHSFIRDQFGSETFGLSEFSPCSETQDLMSRMSASQQRYVGMNSLERALYGFENSVRNYYTNLQCQSLEEDEQRDSNHNNIAKEHLTTQKPDSSKRSKRSTYIVDVKHENLEVIIRQRMMDFAFVSLKDRSKAKYLNQTFKWSTDFNELYEKFLKDDWTNVFCQDSSSGFDNFLYFKLRQHPDWFECIFYENSIKDEWCLAVRRILLKTDSEGKNPWLQKSDRPETFAKDRVTVYELLNKIPVTDSKSTQNKMTDIKIDDLQINDDVINLAAFMLTFAQINPCIKSARKKRTIYFTDQSHKRNWFLGSQGHFWCL